MKKYLVIGNPIKHSLSPKLHNHWIKKNNIDAVYEKKQLNENDIEDTILKVRNGEIDGINVTIPFKKEIIPFLDQLTPVAEEVCAVNTIYKENNKVVGHNTDVAGFELAIRRINYDINNKKVFILGAGGAVSAIILALKKMKVLKIILSNRTKQKAEDLKKIYSDLEIIDWGQITDFDMIINATSLGLKNNDQIQLDLSKVGKGKFFYDVIYNPIKTNFLLEGDKKGNQI